LKDIEELSEPWERIARNASCPQLPYQEDTVEGVSALLLSIDAAADFFSSNQTLMKHVPDVLVDISKFKSWPGFADMQFLTNTG
jgi:hypothetical protein